MMFRREAHCSSIEVLGVYAYTLSIMLPVAMESERMGCTEDVLARVTERVYLAVDQVY